MPRFLSWAEKCSGLVVLPHSDLEEWWGKALPACRVRVGREVKVEIT